MRNLYINLFESNIIEDSPLNEGAWGYGILDNDTALDKQTSFGKFSLNLLTTKIKTSKNDDEKWANLGVLVDFLKKYDSNITSCGSEVFHHWLYSVKSKDQILQIQDDIKKIYKSDRSFLERTLNKYVGKQNQGNFIRDLWNGFSIDNWIINHFYTLFLFNLLTCTVLCILFTKLFIILFFINNFILYLLTNSNIYHISSSLGYFLKLCFSLSKIEESSHTPFTYILPFEKEVSRNTALPSVSIITPMSELERRLLGMLAFALYIPLTALTRLGTLTFLYSVFVAYSEEKASLNIEISTGASTVASI
jgi:hypothetical protein